MGKKLKLIRILKVFLILILFFSIFPETTFSFEDIYAGTDYASAEETNTCKEHNCPVLPNKLFHHCAVCCVLSHSFITLSSGIVFHFSNTFQPSSITGDILYKELFPKTVFHPPQSIL